MRSWRHDTPVPERDTAPIGEIHQPDRGCYPVPSLYRIPPRTVRGVEPSGYPVAPVPIKSSRLGVPPELPPPFCARAQSACARSMLA